MLFDVNDTLSFILYNDIIQFVIAGIASGLIFLALLFVAIQCFRRHRYRRRSNLRLGVLYEDETDVMLKHVKDDKKTCKVSDLDICNIAPPSPRPPPVPNRPASYTPSNHDSLNTLNNFDNIRNYGSAADELENCHNIPYTQEFLASFAPPPRSNASMPPSLPPPPPSNPASDTDSIQKPMWENEYPNMLENLEGMHINVVYFHLVCNICYINCSSVYIIVCVSRTVL